ncbi:MAG: PAS domain-containing protein [Candidatus Zixiibacteriota bacterium]|nr:MAG: PAS domain-containing protein [candidate division Zixibacteria bacterium]
MSTMGDKEYELRKLEELAESFTNMGVLTRMVRDSYSVLESKIDDENSRLARVNDLLRKSLEERNKLADYLNTILESVDSGVIVTDHEGRISIFNSAAERFTGISAGSALGRYYKDALRTAASPEADRVITGKMSSASGEKTLRPRNDIEIPVAYSITRLRSFENNRMGGAVEIFYNLTEIRKLEANLRRISTLAALGEMAATVAHEIRNPLSGIAGFAALLSRDLEGDHENLEIVDKIKKGVNALNAIVTNLLDFTKTVDPNRMEIDPSVLIAETIEDVKADLESRNHTFDFERGSLKLRANLDPDLFRQIVFNLAKNAVQTNPDGGHVRLKLTRSSASNLVLKVEDDGPGISDEIRDRIFTPFFTTKTNGIGLGLATVKKLVELHGGRIEAGNRPGGGAVFTVNIPNIKGDLS